MYIAIVNRSGLIFLNIFFPYPIRAILERKPMEGQEEISKME
jgi:hypothetical protein